MNFKKSEVKELVVVGTGIAGLSFVDKYLERGKNIHIISPESKQKFEKKANNKIKVLPSQMRGEFKNVYDYYSANNLNLSSDCKAIGALNFGGLSNYWGLQIDSYIQSNQKYLKNKTFDEIKKNFIEFLKRYKLVGSFKEKKIIYENQFSTPPEFEILKKNKENFTCRKPILAFSCFKKFTGDLNKLNENKQKLTAKSIFKNIKNKKKIKIHNYYLEKISIKKGLIQLFCKNNGQKKLLITKKLVLASGTIATTKILMDFLKIKKEIKIKHHPRLLSVFFSKKKLNYNLNFTPSLFQITNNSSDGFFTADLRPGNKLITKSIIDAFPFMKPFEFIINIFRKRLIFSNFLLDSKFSNLYLKKKDNKFNLYNKKNSLVSILKKKNKKIFKLLLSKGLVLPIFKTFFPGYGADYHYFGSVPFAKKGKLAVNNNCQLLPFKNIYIVDGSVFDFRINKYPLGIVAANARRIAKYLS